jgi:hypothetical protein
LTNSVVADAGSYDVVVSGTPAVTSSPVTVTVNAAPIAPAFTQVNPTCLVGTGSVSVTSPVSGSTYTLTGIISVAAQTGTSFATLAAGTYELTQTNATGCISSPLVLQSILFLLLQLPGKVLALVGIMVFLQ